MRQLTILSIIIMLMGGTMMYAEDCIIRYTTTLSEEVELADVSGFDGTLVSNTYTDDGGTLVFKPKNGDHVTTIGDMAFHELDHVTSVILPEGIKRIGFRAFSPTRRLYSIVLPSTLDSIGERAFHGAKLDHVDLPEGIRTLSYFCFGFTLLTDFKAPSTVTTLKTSCFECCYFLQTIDLPAGLKCIESYAFANCPSLHSITFRGTMAQWNAIKKQVDWCRGGWQATPLEVVHCSDGDIAMTPWFPKEKESVATYTVSIPSAQWTSMCLPICTSDIPDGVTVYRVDGMTRSVPGSLILTPCDHILAFKPYLVSGNAGDYNFTGQFYKIPENESPYLGLLQGCTVDQRLKASNCFVLQQHGPNLGFYRVGKGKPIDMPQHKAYILLPTNE